MKLTDAGNRYALTALRDRRASLAGEVISLKKKLAWAEGQLVHLDATLRLFDPGYQDGDVPPRKTYKRLKFFRQGELSRLILDVLRKAGKPASTAEVVTAVIAAMGHDEAARPALAPRVRTNLQYLEKQRGLVVKTGQARTAKWALVESA